MFRSVDLPIQRSAKPHNHEPMSEYVFVLTQTHVKNQDLQQAQQLELGKKKKNRTQFGVKKKKALQVIWRVPNECIPSPLHADFAHYYLFLPHSQKKKKSCLFLLANQKKKKRKPLKKGLFSFRKRW